MATKCDKDNLVSSSIMLVNNPVSENMVSYYPESQHSSQALASSSTSSEDFSYVHHDHIPQHMGPFSFGTYHPYSYEHTNRVMFPSRNCMCRSPPVQETFLHQILVGKGYKNDKMYVAPRPMIKQEPDFHDYGCCYGYPMYTDYHRPAIDGFISKNRLQFQGLSSSN